MAVQRDDLPTLEIRISRASDTTYSVELRLGEREFPRGTLGPELLQADGGDDHGARLFARFTADEPIRMAWSLAAALHPQRRIRLRLDDLAPALHTLAWEALTDTSPTATARTLAADRDTPFSRHVATAAAPPGPLTALPIKILTAVAAPTDIADYDLPPLDRAAEIASIAEALAAAPPGRVQHTHLAGPCTLAALEAELEHGYHVLHLLAHGMARRDGAAATFFEAADGRTDRVDAARFAAMLDRLTPTLRLVALMSCQSATRSRTDARVGLAPQLLAAGVPAVLAMQDLVPVDTARAFTRAFYRELCTTGEIDRAANRARAVILTARLPGDAIPVLYSAAASNRLWTAELPATPVAQTQQAVAPSAPAQQLADGPRSPTRASAPAPSPPAATAKPAKTAPGWRRISGPFADVQLARQHDGRLTLFVINHAHEVRTCTQVAPDGAWGPWETFCGDTRKLRVLADNRGRLCMFTLDLKGAAWCCTQTAPAGAWNKDWTLLGGVFTDLTPAVFADNRLIAFGIDKDRYLFGLEQTEQDGAWEDEWSEVDGEHDEVVALRDPQDTIHVFTRDGQTIYHLREDHDAESGWADLYEFDGVARRLALIAVPRTRELHLFTIGGDRTLWLATMDQAGEWGDWQNLGGDHVDLAPIVVDGHAHLYAVGRDGAVWAIRETDDGVSDWTRLGGEDFTRVLVARTLGNHLRIVALDRAGVLHGYNP